MFCSVSVSETEPSDVVYDSGIAEEAEEGSAEGQLNTKAPTFAAPPFLKTYIDNTVYDMRLH